MKSNNSRRGLRLTSALLSAAMLLSAAPALAAADEAVPGDAQMEAAAAVSPAATREYVIAALARAAGLEDAGSEVLSAFSDAGAVSPELAPALAAAVECGAVLGYEDATLRPVESVTRLEALLLLGRLMGEGYAYRDPIAYRDVPAWAKEELDAMSAAGETYLYSDRTLGAREAVTEAEADALAEYLSEQVYLEELFQTADLAQVLQRRESVLLEMKEDTATPDTTRIYFSPDRVEGNSSDRHYLYADGYFLYVPEHQPNDRVIVLNISPEDYRDYIDYEMYLYSAYAYRAERILRNEVVDGKRYVSTVTADPALAKSMSENFGIYPYDDDYYVSENVFDAETGELLSMDTTLCRSDDYTKLVQACVYTYDAAYDTVESYFASPYYTADATRNITVTYAPGTAEEQTVTAALPKGLGLVFMAGDRVAYNFFTDPDCTVAYEGGTPEDFSNLRLYLSPATVEAEYAPAETETPAEEVPAETETPAEEVTAETETPAEEKVPAQSETPAENAP